MIKATLEGPEGKKLILFGLSEGNVQRLNLGQPILIHGEKVGTTGTDYVILWGKTEMDIIREMKGAGYLPPDYPEEYPDEPEEDSE